MKRKEVELVQRLSSV